MSVGGLVQHGMQQFLDNNGDPLAAGKVFFYAPSTLNPVTTYADADLTIPNTNPVRLDGAGRANIFYTATVRQILKSVNDVTIWDKVTSPASSQGQSTTSIDNMAALRALTSPLPTVYLRGYYTPNDGGEGNFIYAVGDTTSPDNGGTVVVTTNGLRYYRQLRNNEAVDVKWFGARNDGSDATAFINNALGTGHNVVVSFGTFKTTAPLYMAANGQHLYGLGEYQSVIQPVGSFTVISPNSALDTVHVHDLGFEAAGMTDGYIFNNNNADRVFVHNLRINHARNLFYIKQCNLADFDRIYAYNIRGLFAWRLEGPTSVERSDVIRILNSNIGGITKTWTGVSVDGFVNTVVSRSLTLVNCDRGVHFANGTGNPLCDPLFGFFYDLEVDFCNREPVYLGKGNTFIFETLYAQGSDNSSGFFTTSDVSSVKINNGYIRGNFGFGIDIASADTDISNTQIVFNSFPKLTKYDAVSLRNGANRVLFSNCHFGGMKGIGAVARYGIRVEPGVLSVRVAACDFYGCALGDIEDNSNSGIPGNIQIVASGAQEFSTDARLNGFRIGTQSGKNATGAPIFSGSSIVGVSITNAGVGYRAPPVVVAFDPQGTGSGFAATANIGGAGEITSITVTNSGGNYGAETYIAIRPNTGYPKIKGDFPGQPDVSVGLEAAGTGSVLLGNASGTGFGVGVVGAGAANFLFARGQAPGITPDLIAQGPDADINLGLAPKGGGHIAISNGHTTGVAGAQAGFLYLLINGSLVAVPFHAP